MFLFRKDIRVVIDDTVITIRSDIISKQPQVEGLLLTGVHEVPEMAVRNHLRYIFIARGHHGSLYKTYL